MRQSGGRGGSTRIGVRGATLVAIALCSMLLVPALAAGIVTTPTATPAPAPVNTAAPTLTGTPTVGSTLTCGVGTWANNPTSFSYTWLRNGAAIAGQVGSIYVVQSADRGTSISCRVTAGNSGGDYTISSLPSGSYNVAFYAEHEEGQNYLEQYFNGKSLIGEANAVPVTAPNVTGGVNAELHPGGQITGRVVDANTHAPVVDVLACAAEASGKDEFGGCGFTNSNGEYVIAGLPSGSYTVDFESFFSETIYRIDYYNGKSSLGEAEAVGVTAGNATTGINAELQSPNEGGQISGTVTKASGGAAIAGMEICAYEAEGEELFGGCTFANSGGAYTLTGLARRKYRVEFWPYTCASGESECTQLNYIRQYWNDTTSEESATLVDLKTSPTASGINAKMVEGGEVNGRVTAASGGAPIDDVFVCSEEITTGGDCATTDSNGEYKIIGLQPGSSYTVTFSPDSGNYLSQSVGSVSVSSGKSTEVNAKLAEAGQISGRVTDASTHAAISGVEVCSDEGDSGRCEITNANGEYAIVGLATGTYRVEFFPEEAGLNYLSQIIEGVTTNVGSTHAGVNAEMHAGGVITGTVTDASTHVGISSVEACAIATDFERCAPTTGGAASAFGTSNALAIAGMPTFTLAKKPTFDAKTNDILFFFKVGEPGTFRWNLSFKNSDVGFASAVEASVGSVDLALAEASKKKSKSKKCKKGEIKHHGKCVRSTVPFGSGSKGVAAGTVEIKVHASSKAIKGLKAHHALHVSGPFTFQVAGASVTHTESVTVRLPKKKSSKKHGKK